MRRGHVFAAENQHTGAGARLAFPSCSADIGTGGWQWTSHSPTGSGPEGSSPNELRFGSLVSLPLNFKHVRAHSRRARAADTMNDAPLPMPTVASGSYRVLARKYRPASFQDLIG